MRVPSQDAFVVGAKDGRGPLRETTEELASSFDERGF